MRFVLFADFGLFFLAACLRVGWLFDSIAVKGFGLG